MVLFFAVFVFFLSVCLRFVCVFFSDVPFLFLCCFHIFVCFNENDNNNANNKQQTTHNTHYKVFIFRHKYSIVLASTALSGAIGDGVS